MQDSKYIAQSNPAAQGYGHGMPHYNNFLRPIMGEKMTSAQAFAIQNKSIYGNFPLTYHQNPNFRTPKGKMAQVF
jgi:hypothetical protein